MTFKGYGIVCYVGKDALYWSNAEWCSEPVFHENASVTIESFAKHCREYPHGKTSGPTLVRIEHLPVVDLSASPHKV